MGVVSYYFQGLPLPDAPSARNVAAVEVTNLRSSSEPIIVENEEQIQDACNVFTALRYQFGDAMQEEDNFITIVYHFDDGSVKTLEVAGEAVTWNGKSYYIKESDFFVQLVEGLFGSVKKV